MKIVFFTAFATPHRGGVERASLDFARRLVTAGHEVAIIACNTESAAARETIDGVEVIRLPCVNLAANLYPIPLPGRRMMSVLRELRRRRPDIVGTYTRFYLSSLLGLLVARWLRRPLYHVEHGSRTYKGADRVTNAAARVADALWGRLVVRRADRLLAASADVASFLATSLGAPRSDLFPSRVDTREFRPDAAVRASWRQRLGLDGRVAIVFCGRLVVTKGIVELVKAFEALPDDAVLVLAGDGPDAAMIPSHPRILRLGELDDEGVLGVLNAADVFVNPSYSEGLPHSVLEAGAVGVAVVATDVGGTREIISSDELGALIPAGDVDALRSALEAVVDDEGLRTRTAAAIRRRVGERFAWDDSAVNAFFGPRDRRPRVAVFVPSYLPLVGGVELRFAEIAERLPDFEFHVICGRLRKGLARSEKLGPVRVHRVGPGTRFDAWLLPFLGPLRARRLDRTERFAFMLAIQASQGAAAAVLFSLVGRKMPFLLSLHDGDEDIRTALRMLGPLYRSIYRRADRIRAISTHLADHARRMGYTGPLEVIPNAVDARRFASSAEARRRMRTRFGADDDTTIVLTAGRLVARKRIDAIVTALRYLEPAVRLVVVGSGPEERGLRITAERAGVSERVRWLGPVPHDEMPDVFAAADMFVLASRSESFGNVILEAMAAGVPVVASDVEGVRDIVQPDVTGLRCEPGDPMSIAAAVRRLTEDEQLRERLVAAAAAEVARRFTVERVASVLGTVFTEMAEAGSRPL